MKRRVPAQHRSRALVDALVEAAARLVSSVPTDRLSTSRIAELAGVSIGSLYQYFEDKQALLVELVRRRLQTDVDLVVEHAERDASGSFEGFTRGLVAAMAETHRRDRKLYARILPLVPLLGLDRTVRRAVSQVMRRVGLALGKHEAELRPRDQELTMYIVTQSLQGVLHAIVLERPELFDHPQLVDELTLLITRYLRKEPS